MTKYINFKSVYGTETIEQIDLKDFKTYKEFRIECRNLLANYIQSGMSVYLSRRATKDWQGRQ